MKASTPALKALKDAGVAYQLHEDSIDRSTKMLPPNLGAQVAASMGVDDTQMFKTLVVVADGEPYCVVVPVGGRLNLRALARAVGAKSAKMAPRDEAMRLTGYVLGGVSPFGMRTTLPTVVDESAMDWESIFISAGKRGLVAEIAPKDLVSTTDAQVGAIARY